MTPSKLLIFASLSLTFICEAATIRVPADYPTVAGALYAAVNGDTIIVADGVYNEGGLQMLGKAILLRSENGPANCTLNGYQMNYPVFYMYHGETRNSIIQGFTIRGLVGEPGTGVFLDNSSPTIIGNIFTGNYGTAIDCYNSSPLIANNLIAENGVGFGSFDRGGGVFAYGPNAKPIIVGNTIAFNAGFVAGVFAAAGADPHVVNCIIWGNVWYDGSPLNISRAEDWHLGREARLDTVPAYSSVEGMSEGGNINSYPDFVYVDDDARIINGDWVSMSDFRLLSTSPCINGGLNAGLPTDVGDIDQDGNITEALPFDIDGSRRISGLSIDMGCYEFQLGVTASIDIKPGSADNSINLGSKGLIPVAILSSPTFDATTIDPATVFLAGAGVAIRGKGNNYLFGTGDVNGDGLADITVHVDTENLDPSHLQNGFAIIVAATQTGEQVTGSDNITIVPK